MEAVALLRQAEAAGLLLVPQGDQLVVRGPKTAAAVVTLLRDHKPEVMRALFFRERYREALAFQQRMGRERSPGLPVTELERVAQNMAWNTVAAEWHRQHGERIPAAICAGCGKPLAGAEVLLLPHGEHAHADPDLACVIAYGRKWKRAAAIALAQYGISAPRDDDEDEAGLEVGAA
jgi:hypothetical protein